ncbi:hypothetical protein BVG79_01061 [Ketogulonicigenium robustum]|uniref:Uncharacterized protein n=1 Tax=Ketogulonicigenium robustum TaxID=92947 RepID=A0A1W6NZF5_9RHOB|nr:hypothetical protein [Ketogulonicigenium robustum]ARO14407.1 hypothetical protein BVG79_01061 [Ketogulonicigenium robustum]
MNALASVGHNNPPDPIEEICGQYESWRIEAENWLDGSPVETESQMNAVDELRQSMREWRLKLEAGQKSATAPLYDAYKAEGARWKPTIEDAKRIEAGLVSVVNGFKQKLAAEKAEAERQARAEADRKMREAQEAAARANAADIEAQRAAAAAQHEAEIAAAQAAKAGKDRVKGLRTVTRYEVTDHRSLLNFIARNDRDAITAFIDDWARRNHTTTQNADGLRVWQEKEAF